MNIHIGNYGNQIKMTLADSGAPIDLSNATLIEMIFLKPDRSTRVARAATLVTDGTDGAIQYTTVQDDIDQEGTWMVQAHFRNPAGEFYSDPVRFTVAGNL